VGPAPRGYDLGIKIMNRLRIFLTSEVNLSVRMDYPRGLDIILNLLCWPKVFENRVLKRIYLDQKKKN
jgi:hypothetical protein